MGLVVLELDPVNEGPELEDLLPGTLVVPTEVLRQLLTRPPPGGSTAGARDREEHKDGDDRTSQCTMIV